MRAPDPVLLGELPQQDVQRWRTGIPVLDRVLGGGLVAGSAILLAGEPGIGKSTLLLQLGAALDAESRSVLYVSAEESARQILVRADRLASQTDGVHVVAETVLEPILELLESGRFSTVLVDSIQALRSAELSGLPGGVSQVRHVASRLIETGKRTASTVIMVGHITKDGVVAGPKSLEHVVDTVLSFEGEGAAEYRILRASKNRFGPTGEVAMFEMRDTGLEPITNPSRVLVSQHESGIPGAVVTSSLQGLRPLLVEVQALVHATSFPSPRRMAVGCDANRLILLIAVLERFGRLSFAEQDVFVNVVGGLSLREPAADLAMVAALVSALLDRPVPAGSVVFGEVGLLGEVRPVSRAEARLKTAFELGYRQALMPSAEGLLLPSDLLVHEIAGVSEMVAFLQR